MPSLAARAERIAHGSLSPRELVEQALARIAEREPEVRAWSHVAADEARAAADALAFELETSGPRGPLHGIPCGIKDIFDVAGMPCEWGSEAMRGRVPERDAALVAELRRQGAVILGKTATTAFAYFDPAPTRNPRNLAHSPGGSSSGSAAAVADGMVPFAVGSQTMGSVLRPASFCGVAGFKPGFGELPLEGVMPFAPSLDHAGLFAPTVEDLALVWSALRPVEPARPARRLWAPRWPIEGALEAAMADGFAKSLERLRAAGFEVVESEPPPSFLALPGAILTVNAYEAARTHGERLRPLGASIGAKLAALLDEGAAIPESAYLQALESLDDARRGFAALSEDFPATATPSALGPAPQGQATTGDPRANAPWTALGVPAISVPFGAAPGGLPLGLQLSAPRGAESRLLATALEFERLFAAGSSPSPVIGSN